MEIFAASPDELTLMSENSNGVSVIGELHLKPLLNVVSVCLCSPAAYRRFAPMGGRPYEKQLELFLPFANICLRHNLNTIEKGQFLLQYVMFCQKMVTDGSISGEKTLSAENNAGSNRDNSNYVLIMAIDVDLGSELTTRWRCIK
jgi:hypothetical protein